LIKSKIAQLRVYPTALNEAQLLHIQTRSFWNLEKQDPAANQLTLPATQSATFAQATAACALQDKTMVTASSRESVQDLLDRAGTDLQTLTWVGALKDGGTRQWKWPNQCMLAETEFFKDFTCHFDAAGITLADAAQQCQSENRDLKIPQNHQFAMLARIKLSCMPTHTGCRFCDTPSTEIMSYYTCTSEDGEKTLGSMMVGSQDFDKGLASEDACVIAGGSWTGLSLFDLQGGWAEGLGLPGLTCAKSVDPFLGNYDRCLSQRHILRTDMAVDKTIQCPEGFEFRSAWGGLDDLYVPFYCCRPSPVCSSPWSLYYTTFCEARGDSHIDDDTNTCLAVLKFQGELRYIAKNCSESLSYVCQDAPMISSAPTATDEADLLGDMKECFDESDLESGSFADTIQQDIQMNTCSWYASRKRSHPQVCSSSAAKQMCPVRTRLLVTTHISAPTRRPFRPTPPTHTYLPQTHKYTYVYTQLLSLFLSFSHSVNFSLSLTHTHIHIHTCTVVVSLRSINKAG